MSNMDKAFICPEFSDTNHISNIYSHCQILFQMMCQIFSPTENMLTGSIKDC